MGKKYDKQLVEGLLQGQGDPTALQWLADGSGDLTSLETGLALSAIVAATRQQRVELLQGLDAAPKLLRKAARRGLHTLKSQGVEVEQVTPSRSFELGHAVIDPDPTALISPADGEGYSDFLLGWTDHQGTCILMGRFGGASGMRDLQHGHSSRAELRRMIRDLGQEAPQMTRVDFDQAMRFIVPAAAQAKELEGAAPHDWEHFAGHVPAERLSPSASELEPLEDLSVLEGSSALANHPWFQLWPVDLALLERMVIAMTKAMQEPSTDQPTDGEVVDMTKILSDLANEGLDDPKIRVEWQRRAGLAALACEAKGLDHAAQLAANLERALAQGTPASKIPLVERNLQATLGWMAAQGRE